MFSISLYESFLLIIAFLFYDIIITNACSGKISKSKTIVNFSDFSRKSWKFDRMLQRCPELECPDCGTPILKSMIKSYNSKQSDEYKKLNTKACPNCNSPIERTGGCVHMECTLCKYGFCWDCLEHWSDYNHTCNR